MLWSSSFEKNRGKFCTKVPKNKSPKNIYIEKKNLFFREEGNLGYSYNDLLEFIETRHQQKVAKENAALLANQNQAAQNVKTEPAAALNSINDLEESWKKIFFQN